MTAVGQRSSTAKHRLARLLSEVFAPVVLTIGLLLVVGAASTPDPLVGLAWGLLAALFVGVIPYAFLLLGIRRGRWTNRHVPIREQRAVPMTFALVSVIAGVAALTYSGAPQQLVALVISGLAGLVVALAITMVWKVSVHASVASGTAIILVLVFGPALHIAWLLVASVGWSRIELREHSAAQVVAGAVIGGSVASTAFLAFR